MDFVHDLPLAEMGGDMAIENFNSGNDNTLLLVGNYSHAASNPKQTTDKMRKSNFGVSFNDSTLVAHTTQKHTTI